MIDERDALINNLLKVNRRWRAVAIAALVLVFVVLIPFTMGFWWLVRNRESRDMELQAVMEEQRRVAQQTLHRLEDRQKDVQQKAETGSK